MAPERAPLRRRRTPALLGPLAALALLVLAAWLTTPGFLDLEWREGRLWGAPVDVLHRAAPVALAALGMALVLGTGGVDLSVGSVLAIAGTLAALRLDAGGGAAGAAALALLAGLLLGLFNGALVAFLKLQPIVATLVLFTAGRGIAQVLSDGRIVTFDPAALAWIASGTLAGLPASAWLVAATAAALAGVLRASGLRLDVEALGDAPAAARLGGVPVPAVLLAVYALSALLASLAGLLVAAEIRAADAASAGLYLELDAILAAVLGGARLEGGRVRLAGALLGALALQVLTTAVLMQGLGSDAILVVKALAVLALVGVQSPRVRAWLPRRGTVRA